MSIEIERLQQTIETEKFAITRNLDALEDKARAMLDWREPIRSRPLDAVALALLSGGILALLFGGRRKRNRRPISNGPEAPAPEAPRQHGVRSRMVEALTTMAVAKAVDVLHRAGDRANPPPTNDHQP
jgi:hypothetical protein